MNRPTPEPWMSSNLTVKARPLKPAAAETSTHVTPDPTVTSSLGEGLSWLAVQALRSDCGY